MKDFVKKHRKALCIALEYGLLMAVSFLIYRLWARPAAIEFRGGTAIGGEICVFALPFLWGMIKCGIRDIRNGIFNPDNWGWDN